MYIFTGYLVIYKSYTFVSVKSIHLNALIRANKANKWNVTPINTCSVITNLKKALIKVEAGNIIADM